MMADWQKMLDNFGNNVDRGFFIRLQNDKIIAINKVGTIKKTIISHMSKSVLKRFNNEKLNSCYNKKNSLFVYRLVCACSSTC